MSSLQNASESTIRKTALTAYGLIGTDWTRVTAAFVDGVAVFVRADGTNAIVPLMPSTFRTSGDIVNVAAQLGKRVNISAVPSIGLLNHAWKGEYTLEQIASKFGVSQEIVGRLQVTYGEAEELAA